MKRIRMIGKMKGKTKVELAFAALPGTFTPAATCGFWEHSYSDAACVACGDLTGCHKKRSKP